ncbi:MAG: HAD-IC family P-type ATPase [Bacillaceae bacterium]|nr:HAD-IC family P-type ATPase [Bacillaceae bacterium]
MLTGDNKIVGKVISEELGLNNYYSELLPDEKVKQIKQLQKSGITAMVGDGVNDAPALALADVGIAMGGAGSDSALETADIVLMSDDLDKLPFIINTSRQMLKIIKQNIFFAIAIKLLAIFLIVPGWLTLWLAIFADMGATILVTLNAIRLFKIK